ncbi:hypothetical protein [Algoriphagus aquimarinus]|uniref:Uncharacterized protein n=1 Tax=Algoriphagus aquimarinus TaxID=237018 RepID=A0A1I1CCX7_9BACT|nr:hypothetical protein [Algoriphagus aquimarinus]SFB60511.1 hypothetical protein SAMN04489723_12929 [Algoriphagus aquimarinus]|tara:strand:+ start:90324 stop:90818 length:495 start_codon:yes stop_codon:yes gene_type:complete
MISIDPITLAVSSFAMVASASPFLYYSYKLKRISNENLATFEEFSSNNNVMPTQHERWRNHYHLGLDSQYKKLVYHRFGSYPEQSVIDLKEVIKVSIQEKIRRVQVGKEKRYILEFLALQFHFKDFTHSPKTIEIYDGELFTSVAGEKGIAEKWQKILENHLKD